MTATVLGVLAFVAGLVGLVSRYLPIKHESVLVLAAGSPYLTGAGLAAMIMSALGRQWVLVILAACLTLAMVGVQLPRYLGPQASAVPTATVRVLSANLGLGRADPDAVVNLARGSADVLVLQEMTPAVALAMSSAGLDDAFPHRVVDPREGAAGIGVWSRYPIVESRSIGGYALPMLSARIRVPDVVAEATVLAVHLAAPWVQPLHLFTEDMARLPTTLREGAHDAGAGAVIVAGDFNATYDMLPLRQLLDEGYRDGAEQAGAGLARSYPSQPWRRPMIGIDHVLVYNCAAMSAHTVSVPGSDHRGLVTTIAIPVDPTAS
jgi:endonuclease/exonuclease/phosphatase (EEP) superfamily protein YafD